MSDFLQGLTAELDRQLAEADARLGRQYPGERGVRQPVHTVYVPADRFDRLLTGEWSAAALDALDRHAPTPEVLAEVVGLDPELVAELLPRVRRKLAEEPIEDLRIDFEDGYGTRPDADEDADIARASAELVAVLGEDAARPSFHGIRFKSFEAPTRTRGVRTLVGYVGALAAAGVVDDGFIVTLPKVTAVEQVEAMARACAALESELGLAKGALRFEIQVETPQSIMGSDGTALVARMIHAAAGRCTSLHYGTYDYSASCGIAAEYQSMEHPAADHAKAVMQVAAAGTGVMLSDGSTNVVPVGSTEQVHAAWRLHARLVRRSLERGFYQGWDLHPAQLPTRYLATYAFYVEGFPAAAARLAAYVGKSADSGFLDEPATAKALASFVLRGLECGALDAETIRERTGLDATALAGLAGRS